MTFEDLARRKVVWLDGSGVKSHLIISSRVRLARNLNAWFFPHRATDAHRLQIIDAVLAACAQCKSTQSLMFFEAEALSDPQRQLLVERHLISPALVKRKGKRGVLIGACDRSSIMVNEEDHLRFQAIVSGYQTHQAWQAVGELESELSGCLAFAVHKSWGYLTACPSNTGTGLRASVLIHLPGLVLTQEIDGVVRGVTQMGFAVRGLFGEGTGAAGNLFQVSNQITMGHTSRALLAMLDRVVEQLVACEENARETLWRDARAKIEDKIWRAYALLTHARLLTTQEFMNLSSAVRLGIGMQVFDRVSVRILNELIVETQPSHLQYLAGRRLEASERDAVRAEWVREKTKISA